MPQYPELGLSALRLTENTRWNGESSAGSSKASASTLTYRRDGTFESLTGASREEQAGSFVLRRSRPAWRGQARRRDLHRLFPGGSAWPGPSGSSGSGRLLASGWRRDRRADRTWTGGPFTGDC